MDYTNIKLKEIMELLPISHGEKSGDCAVCKSKIRSDGKSWMNMSTGIKAAYWLAFCAVGVICVLFPNEKENGTTFEEQTISLQERVRASDIFRIFDETSHA